MVQVRSVKLDDQSHWKRVASPKYTYISGAAYCCSSPYRPYSHFHRTIMIGPPFDMVVCCDLISNSLLDLSTLSRKYGSFSRSLISFLYFKSHHGNPPFPILHKRMVRDEELLSYRFPHIYS